MLSPPPAQMSQRSSIASPARSPPRSSAASSRITSPPRARSPLQAFSHGSRAQNAEQLSIAQLQHEAQAAHNYAMQSPALSSYSGARPPSPPFQPTPSHPFAHSHSHSNPSVLQQTQFAHTQQAPLASHAYEPPQHHFELDSLSASAGGPQAAGDVSRVQVLMRLLELEKRLARADDRARMAEDANKLRFAELVSNNALSADRASTFLQRLSEVELLSRECAIGVQSVESKVSMEVEAITLLKSHVHSWREESRRELKEEFNKNINLRNATHHQELVSLMDKQQEQAAKIIRAHEMTTQAFATKIAAQEANFASQIAQAQSQIEAYGSEIAQRQRTEEQQEQRISTLQQQIAHMQQLMEQQVAPLHSALDSLRQTQAAQVEQSATKLTAVDGAVHDLRAGQVQLQNSIMAASDGLTSSVAALRDALQPLQHEVQTIQARLEPVVAELTLLKLSEEESRKDGDVLRKTLRRVTHSIAMVEEQLAQIQAKVLVANEQMPYAAAIMAARQSPQQPQQQQQQQQQQQHFGSPMHSPRFHQHSAATVNGHATPFLHPSFASAGHFPGLSSPIPAAGAPSVSVPLSSPFPSIPLPTPSLYGLQMHASDAAGLRTSPASRRTASIDAAAMQQQQQRNGGAGGGKAMSSAEEAFVSSFLGGATL